MSIYDPVNSLMTINVNFSLGIFGLFFVSVCFSGPNFINETWFSSILQFLNFHVTKRNRRKEKKKFKITSVPITVYFN